MRIKLLFTIILGSVLLVACGGANTPVPGPTQAPGPTEAPTQTMPSSTTTVTTAPAVDDTSPSLAIKGKGQRIEGGKLVRLFLDPPTMDPHITTDNVSGALVNEIFGGLVTINPDLEVVGDLAETWETNAEGTVYTFHLNQNAKFHDGKAVTAEDVRWSLERVTDPATQSPVADQYLGDIVGVRAKLRGDADTVSGIDRDSSSICRPTPTVSRRGMV